MKKNLLLSFAALCLSIAGMAQSATSIANGNWTNPLTWNCTCVPLPGYSVTISHSVTLNTSFVSTMGGITINNSGSLVQDANRDIWLNGGGFINNGKADFRYFLASSGTLSNSGTLTVRSFSNNVSFTNTGNIHNVDSIVNNATITNNGTFLTIDSIINSGTFLNNGPCLFHQFTNNGTFSNTNKFTFTDITNNGTLNNSDSIFCLHSVWNQGKISNGSTAFIKLNKSLLNKKASGGTASIDNNGLFQIIDSYYNFDTIRGLTGRITVQDSSVNYGKMLGSFDFCDATCTITPVGIDFNFGTVSPNITYCHPTGLKKSNQDNAEITLYPNPANDRLFITAGKLQDFEVSVTNLNGLLIFKGRNISSIDLSNYKEGLYFMSVSSGDEVTTRKFQIIKN